MIGAVTCRNFWRRAKFQRALPYLRVTVGGHNLSSLLPVLKLGLMYLLVVVFNIRRFGHPGGKVVELLSYGPIDVTLPSNV